MPLLPLDIPPGVVRNGTDLESSNRWRDVNLVRWVDGILQPVRGWTQKSDNAAASAIRGMHAWVTNDGTQYFAGGTHSKLHIYDANGAQKDITPAGFTTGRATAVPATGFGYGTYGSADYGTERPDTGSTLPATTWHLDNWGEFLVGCSVDDGKLYEWQLDYVTPTVAATISGAPTSCRGLIVTEDRFLMALGAGGNGRKLQWSDREDNTTWTPAATNEAGDIELQTQGKIQQGVRVTDQTLILTTTDAHTATYIGPPFVFRIERVGTNCGSISSLSAAGIQGGAMWMGRSNFFMYSGGQVQRVPCEVGDYVFNDINRGYVSHIVAVPNSRYSEIWWFYPSSASTENNRYVVYDYGQNIWSVGSISRTSGVDQGAFNNPLMASDDFHIQEHELGYNHQGETVYAETGPISLGTGDQVMVATHLYPDESTQGDVTATFKTRFYPNDTEYTHGAYSMSAPTSVRFTGRQMRMRVTGQVNDAWRVGTFRLEVRPGGKR